MKKDYNKIGSKASKGRGRFQFVAGPDGYYRDPEPYENGMGICYISCLGFVRLENKQTRMGRLLRERELPVFQLGYSRKEIVEAVRFEAAERGLTLTERQLSDICDITFYSLCGGSVSDSASKAVEQWMTQR